MGKNTIQKIENKLLSLHKIIPAIKTLNLITKKNRTIQYDAQVCSYNANIAGVN